MVTPQISLKEAERGMAKRTKSAVEVKEVSQSGLAQSPLFGVALLKIAMELKRDDGRELEEILTGVLRTMNLAEVEFRKYLAQNGGLLRGIADRGQR
jgi:hypothetical protein